MQIADFLLPIAEGVSGDHPAVFKGVLHITQVALRNLRNTTVCPVKQPIPRFEDEADH